MAYLFQSTRFNMNNILFCHNQLKFKKVKYICLLKCTDGFQVFNGMVLYGMYKINLNKTSHLNTELKKNYWYANQF